MLRVLRAFEEQNTFVSRSEHKSQRFILYVLDKLKEERSFSSVAREVGLSVSNVIRIFDIVGFKKPEVPRVIGIDEFKGDTNGEKYQCILTDIENGIVLDILPMWDEHYFINYSQVIDKYHYVRQAIWAFQGVRREVQTHLTPQQRKYFIRSKKSLTSRIQYLKDEEKQQVHVMLYCSATLSSSHYLKELFFKVIDQKILLLLKSFLLNGLSVLKHLPFPNLKSVLPPTEIGLLALPTLSRFPYTNGFTKGCNNKIKVLKRNAYGYRDFSRFRNRILFLFSHQKVKKQEACIRKLPALFFC